MRVLVIPALLVGLSGCAMQRTVGQPQDFKQAAAAPLYDVNVLRTKIPESLVIAEARPYVLPSPLTCAVIAKEVAALDEDLGPDLDTPETENNPSMLARSQGAAVNLVRGGAQSLVPFRGWVRRLSGAERTDRIVNEAITAGGVRRAYLKGLGQTQNCPPPASPNRNSIEGKDIDPPRPTGPQYPIR